MPLPAASCKPQQPLQSQSGFELLGPCMGLELLTFNADSSLCSAVIRERVVMKALVGRFIEDESGASAVEYAVVAGIIAIGIIVSIGAIRDSLNGIFNNTASEIK
jgi:pilus assembly protein Flp/PilA